METKVKTSISLSPGVHRRIKREAKRQRRSVSQIVELWIESAANKGKWPIPEVNGSPAPVSMPTVELEAAP